MSDSTHAIFIDGGFFQKEFYKLHKLYPKAKDIEDYCFQYRTLPLFSNSKLYRIFFYNSLPSEISAKHPITGRKTTKFTSHVIAEAQVLWDELDRSNFFAMRKGTLKKRGWTIKRNVIQNLQLRGTPTLIADDLEIQVIQKQVDLKLGMDIAHLAFKSLVKKILLLTNDGDLAPAAKLARVEGIQVFLDTMNNLPPRELITHSDVLLRSKPPVRPSWAPLPPLPASVPPSAPSL